jgi:outer membrane protein OmpA-like peptidoglycan-associated protein
MLRRLTVCSAAVLGLLCGQAAAEPLAKGFALDRFEPSERGSEWFSEDSLDLRGRPRFATGIVFDYARKPLVFYAPDGSARAPIVDHQLYGHLGGAAVLWDRVRFALDLPVALFQDGERAATSANRFGVGDHTAFGDVRAGADVRLFGRYREPITMAAGFQLHLPTGSRAAYTSDGAVRFVPRVLAAGEIGGFVYTARLGVNVRARSDAFAGKPTGSEIQWGAAAGARLGEGRIVIGPELFGSTVITNADAYFTRPTTPLELLFGGHFLAADAWRAGVGVGPGLTRAFGTPLLRFVASLEWVEPVAEAPPNDAAPDADRDGIPDDHDACPRRAGDATNDPDTNGCPPPKDRDGDGIPDDRDACPFEAGGRTDEPRTNGCPPPKDRDGDGIADDRDACPLEPGASTGDPKTTGCPGPKDRDADGIADDRDACPLEAGVATNDQKTNGCPPPNDGDGDGIADPEDACPFSSGPQTADPKTNGCPVAHVEKGQIVIREQVQFANRSADILRASDFVLEAVAKILTENPSITKVEVQGHTDDKGNADFNKKLSDKRAASVVRWLVEHGIEGSRLTAVGYGKERPIDSNDTDTGRANNRRVEFHILSQKTPAWQDLMRQGSPSGPKGPRGPSK